MSSGGVNNSLCLTLGRFEVTLPKVCGGVVTTELNTDRTKFFGSACPLRIETIRGRWRIMSGWDGVINQSLRELSRVPCPSLQ